MSKALRILLLEDEHADAELLERELRKSAIQFSLQVVATATTFTKSLKDSRPDLILADYTVPGFGAVEALRVACEVCPEVPFICVSGTVGEELVVDLMRQGAVDYLVKPVSAQALVEKAQAALAT